MDRAYEIEWRKLLIKLLEPVKAKLRRMVAAEHREMARAKQQATGYASYDDAHEAYGVGRFIAEEFAAIAAVMAGDGQIAKSLRAFKHLGDFIDDLHREVNSLRRDDADDVQEQAIRRFRLREKDDSDMEQVPSQRETTEVENMRALVQEVLALAEKMHTVRMQLQASGFTLADMMLYCNLSFSEYADLYQVLEGVCHNDADIQDARALRPQR